MKWMTLSLLMILPCAAMATTPRATACLRDASYEQALRYHASADQTMTPARFLRWVEGVSSGHSMLEPAHEPTLEFRPIVHAKETQGVRVLATFAYKF